MSLVGNPLDNMWRDSHRPTQIQPYSHPYIDVSPKKALDDLGSLLKEKAKTTAAATLPKFAENDSNYVLRWLMPGYAKQDVKVTIVGGRLHVKAENGGLYADETQDFSLAIPNTSKSDETEVVLLDGILYVTIPRVEPVVTTLEIN